MVEEWNQGGKDEWEHGTLTVVTDKMWELVEYIETEISKG